MLVSRGFRPKWNASIMKLVMGGFMSITLNDENNPFLTHARALDMGPPLPTVVQLGGECLYKNSDKSYHKGLHIWFYAVCVP
jgi:hypothetical protein